jgi:Tfp pilus assembly protein FimT
MSLSGRTRVSVEAFSLLELMLIVVILSVASAVCIPNFTRFVRALEFKRSAEDLASVIRYGQIRALTNGRSVKFVMDATGYWLEEERSLEDEIGTGLEQPVFGRIKSRFGRKVSLPQGIELSHLVKDVLLTPDGRIEPVNLQLCRAQECVSVSTDSRIGRVVVSDTNEKTGHDT